MESRGGGGGYWPVFYVIIARCVPVLYRNDLKYCYSSFTNHSSIMSIKQLREIPTGLPLSGALNTGGV